MTYRIEVLDDFSVVGQRIKLTGHQKDNLILAIDFWKKFNGQLKKNYLVQFGHWTKYAFMERTQQGLFYFCAVPKKVIVPNGFEEKRISGKQYLVATYVGKMADIYEAYEKLYKEILPNSGYQLDQEAFLHFEKYDERFKWQKDDSVIEIWVPVLKVFT